MPERNEAQRMLPDLDLHRPSEARLYDLFLGGKNSYEVDAGCSRKSWRSRLRHRTWPGRTGAGWATRSAG